MTVHELVELLETEDQMSQIIVSITFGKPGKRSWTEDWEIKSVEQNGDQVELWCYDA